MVHWIGLMAFSMIGGLGAAQSGGVSKSPWNDIDGMFRRKDWTAYMALFAPEYKRIGVDGRAMNRERHYEAFMKAVGKARNVDVAPDGITGVVLKRGGRLWTPFARRLRILTTEGTMIVIEHAGTHDWNQEFDGSFSIVGTRDDRFKWVDYGAMKQYWPKWP